MTEFRMTQYLLALMQVGTLVVITSRGFEVVGVDGKNRLGDRAFNTVEQAVTTFADEFFYRGKTLQEHIDEIPTYHRDYLLGEGVLGKNHGHPAN